MHRLKPNEITKITRRRTGMRTYCKTKSWDCDDMSIKITGKPLIIMDADRPDNILVHRRRQWTKVTSIFIHHVPVRRRLGHSFTINGEALHGNNESPYHWRDKNLVINTSQRHYRYRIETTIKTPPMARRKKQAYIYQHPETWEGTETLTNTHSYSHIESFFFFSFLAI